MDRIKDIGVVSFKSILLQATRKGTFFKSGSVKKSKNILPERAKIEWKTHQVKNGSSYWVQSFISVEIVAVSRRKMTPWMQQHSVEISFVGQSSRAFKFPGRSINHISFSNKSSSEIDLLMLGFVESSTGRTLTQSWFSLTEVKVVPASPWRSYKKHENCTFFKCHCRGTKLKRAVLPLSGRPTNRMVGRFGVLVKDPE